MLVNTPSIINIMATDKVNQDKHLNDSSDEKLKTDEPISEKDEVKKAEERTRKAHDKANKDAGKKS
ncbi:hypothetical protein QE417_002079 [Mucilaginibacter terrae]|uniref:Uncharacterized protein n=2 Tax=Mucilaginibacter terrae TaxID=1955052 RepID=A0ABU3GTA0_9SPHI|nr:hypothetical protein [Mucilaginibacter terrae]